MEWNCLASCHRFKANAHGLPVVMVPLVLYSDDTSGNCSKKWNKFDVWAMMLAGLARAENSQLENIPFICCLIETSSIEMAEPIVKDLSRLEDTQYITIQKKTQNLKNGKPINLYINVPFIFKCFRDEQHTQ